MTRGIPKSGKRKPGAGRKPLADHLKRKRREIWANDAEYAQILARLRELREGQKDP